MQDTDIKRRYHLRTRENRPDENRKMVGEMKKLDIYLLITLAFFCLSGTAYAKCQIQYTGDRKSVV